MHRGALDVGMMQEPALVPDSRDPAQKEYTISQHLFESFRLRRTWLVGGIVLLLPGILEFLLIVKLLRPQHVGFLFVCLLVIIDLLFASLLGWATAGPLAIFFYIRAVREERKQQSQRYTPLTAVKGMYETRDDEEHRRQEQDILKVVRRLEKPLLILGLPGAGKTTVLQAGQYPALEHSWRLVFGKGRIPIYIPMKDYSAYLDRLPGRGWQEPQFPATSLPYPPSLLDYLFAGSALAGVTYLRPYLRWLAQKGRLVFLCDGLNEVGNHQLGFVCQELLATMKANHNLVIMTCRELDYREKAPLRLLTGPDAADGYVILPLRSEQIKEFVERFVANASDESVPRHRYSATEINDEIKKHGRLGYNCTNPMMLAALIQTIDEVGTGDPDVVSGTRGRLLKKLVSRLITRELQRQTGQGLDEQEVVLFLGQIACHARRLNLRNAITMGRTLTGGTGEEQRSIPIEEFADRLQLWLGDHEEEQDVQGQLVQRPPARRYAASEFVRLLTFAQEVPLITISYNGVLSFSHELIAEYFIGEYLFRRDTMPQGALPFGPELVSDVGAWSEPVTIWTGLSNDQMGLAQRFAYLGQSMGQIHPDYAYNALSLSLACTGVYWSSRMDASRNTLLPQDIVALLLSAVKDPENRGKLAHILDKCASEGATEIYRSLLPLIMETDIDDLLLRLDRRVVPELLFDYLRDAVENQLPVATIEQLVRVLGRFGSDIISRAIELGKDVANNSLAFRVQVLRSLGQTASTNAVAPLIDSLQDQTDEIVEAAVHALVQLGPGLALDALLVELQSQTPELLIIRIHYAALRVFREWLVEHQLSPIAHRRVIEALLLALTSIYKPQIRAEAGQLLQQQCDQANHRFPERWEQVVRLLIAALADRDEAKITSVMALLQRMGNTATPLLVKELQTSRQELALARIVRVIGVVRDPDALRRLLPLLDNPARLVAEQLTIAFQNYAPESIDPLLDVTLMHQSPGAARRATEILKSIGEGCVPAVIRRLEPIKRERTQLLVEILVHTRRPQAITPLIRLLGKLQNEADSDLVKKVIQALQHFPDKQVIPPLIDVLSNWGAPYYQEAGKVLSGFGELALDELVAALDVEQETVAVRRVRTAILYMQPFLYLPLLNCFQSCSERQGRQIEKVFLERGDQETARFLVSQLSHSQQKVKLAVQRMLDRMPEDAVVEPLLDALGNPREYDVISRLLRKYPTSIPKLVAILADVRRSRAAYTILLDFGPQVIAHLPSGLDAPDERARNNSQRLLIALAEGEQEPQARQRILEQIVALFAHLRRGSQGWNNLLDLLTNQFVILWGEQFADLCIPVLLNGLMDAPSRDGCAEALVRLVRHHPVYKETILNALLKALEVKEQRDGAEIALIGLDEHAVDPVSKLIIDQNAEVAGRAQHILSQIGPAALQFVWQHYRDADDRRLQDAVRTIFRRMSIDRILGKLIEWLTAEDPLYIEMGLTLLLERILLEEEGASQKLIPFLLEYVCQHGQDDASQRIIALLLFARKETVIEHLLKRLRDNQKNHPEWLPQILLLPGLAGKAQERLEAIVRGEQEATPQLRAELAAIMGLLRMDEAEDFAKTLNQYSMLEPEGATQQLQTRDLLSMSLRALGGLLAGGRWGVEELRRLRRTSKEGTPEHDLYSLLLGKHFSGDVTKLEEQNADLKGQISGLERQMRKEQTDRMKENAGYERDKQNWQRQKTALEGQLQQARYEKTQAEQQKRSAEQERDRVTQELTTTLNMLQQQQQMPPMP